jgi:hypothetical protein
MKNLLVLLLFLSSLKGYGQTDLVLTPDGNYSFNKNPFTLDLRPDCGTWEKGKMVTGEWKPYDTIGKYRPNEKHQWVYDKEHSMWQTGVLSVYRPCGDPPYEHYEQYRICRLTGTRQRKERYQEYTYKEPLRSDYAKVIDSIQATIPRDTTSYLTTIVGNGTTITDKGAFLTITNDGKPTWSTPEVPKKKKKSRKKK